MVPTSRKQRLLWILRAEFVRRGHETHFLMWVSFLAAFLTSRLWVLTVGMNAPDLSSDFSIGARILVGGYHIHHIAIGIFLVAQAGFLGLHYAGRRLVKAASVMYGIGLGFIVDELGFVVGGITPYAGDEEVFVVVVVISALFLLGIYWPNFYRGLEWPVKRVFRRRGRMPTRVPAGSIGNEGLGDVSVVVPVEDEGSLK